MKYIFQRLGMQVLNLFLFLLCVSICGAVVYCVMSCCSDCTAKRILKLLPLLSPFVWPCFALLLLIVFNSAIHDAVKELPAFIRRSHYGEGSCTIRDVSVKGKGRDVMTVCDTDNAYDQIKKMRGKDFSACPVVSTDGCFYGVFTMEAWIDYRMNGKDVHAATIKDVLCAGDNTRLLNGSIPPDMFPDNDETIRNARSRFYRLGNNHFPLILIFLSEERKVVDMITVFDVLKTAVPT